MKSTTVKRVRNAIDTYWKKHYCSPTLRELTVISGVLSTSHVSGCVEELREQGYLLKTRKIIPTWIAEFIKSKAISNVSFPVK